MKEWSESRRVDSSLADWAATFWLMTEPRMAQVARNKVAEKNARRVRGAIGLGNLKKGKNGAYCCAKTDVLSWTKYSIQG